MITYSNDPTIRFDHTPVVNKVGFKVNQIGPDDPYVFPVKDYTDTDANTIYVNGSTAGNDANAGTEAAPKETLLAAINATTATKTKVIVQDSAIYNEDISGGTYTYLQGIYNDTGQTSSWVGRLLGFTPSDSNAVFVAKTGSDSTGTAGTQADPWLTINAAILDCDTGRDVVVIMDSGTYEEEGFEFTGNFTGLYAAIGETPTLTISDSDSFYIALTTLVARKDTFTFTGGSLGVKGSFIIGGDVYTVLEDTNGAVVDIKMLSNTITSGTQVMAPTVVCASTSGSGDTEWYEGASLLGILYTLSATSTVLRYKTITAAGADSLAATAIYTGANAPVSMALTSIDTSNTVALWRETSSNLIRYKIFNPLTGTEIKAAATLLTKAANLQYMTLLSNGNMFVCYSDTADSFKQRCFSFTPSTGALVLADQYVNGTGAFMQYAQRAPLLSNGYIMAANFNSGDSDMYFLFVNPTTGMIDKTQRKWEDTDGTDSRFCRPVIRSDQSIVMVNSFQTKAHYQVIYPEYSYIKASVASELNGIIINTNEDVFVSELFTSTSALTIKNCELKDHKLPATLYGNTDEATCVLSTILATTSTSTVQYNSLHDCNGGIESTSDVLQINDSKLYRIAYAYAVYIDGAAGTGAGINIEHCDFFDCYGGIHLENNDGGEVIKNCIFHDCSVYAIDAEIALTVTYSVVTSSVTSTVTLGTYTNRGNPDYVNEGYVDPDDTDLNLRVKVLGYPGNSAAYALADDSRNAGSINVKYIGAETAYTSITVPKPNQMKHEYVYAGATNTQRKDGSWTSFKDGQSEVLTMTWDGIAAAYMTQLITMWKSSEYVVLIYPDPVTYPNSFEQWTLIRESLNNSVGTPTLSDLGAQSVTLKFAKAA